MKEQDVRQRIESFLKRTAREVVVPASMGLGLALSGCDHTGIQARADAAADTSQSAATDGIVADATLGRESAANRPDAVNQTDLRLPDDVRLAPDTGQADLPVLIAPYMAIVRLDAGVDASVPDARSDTGTSDAEVPDAGAADTRTPDARPDARLADLPTILPPYMPPPPPDAARDVSAVMPPYMLPPPPPDMASPFPLHCPRTHRRLLLLIRRPCPLRRRPTWHQPSLRSMRRGTCRRSSPRISSPRTRCRSRSRQPTKRNRPQAVAVARHRNERCWKS